MTSPTLDKPQTAIAFPAERRTEVLQELVESATNVVNKQLDAFATRLAHALERTAESCGVDSKAQLYAGAAALLKKNRYPFCYVVSEKLAAALQVEAQTAENPAAADPGPAIATTLEPDLEVDKKLCLIKAGRALEAEQAERFAALNMRLGYVLGRDDFGIAHNPFRPQIFLAAIHDAWCEFQPDRATHPLVYPLLGPDVCVDMGSVLHALNATMLRRGILPELPKLLRAPRVSTASAAQEDADPLQARLRKLFPAESVDEADRPLPDAFPTLMQNTVLDAAAARDSLLACLDAAQQRMGTQTDMEESLLATVKRRMPAELLAPADAVALDLLRHVFDAVFGEPQLPAEMKALIGRLQAPLLKVALNDRNFFFDPRHPARRLIEQLSALGVEWDSHAGSTDQLYQLILRNVKRVQSDHRHAVLQDAVDDVEAFHTRRATLAEEALSAPIAQAAKQARQMQAVKAAKHEVALRIGTGEVVAFVEGFLEDKWVSVLTLAYSVKDEQPQAVDSALKTMDALVWSVKPKITPDERKQLIAKLPSIISMLNKWLDLIKWTDADRTRFFEELARCHASIVRAPVELSPERQLQIALRVAKRAAERRLARQARETPEPEPDQYTHQLEKLVCGTWVELAQNNDAATRVRLVWISAPRNLYLFATRDHREAVSLSDDELAQALREQRARVVLEAGVVERALAQAVGEDAANNDATDNRSAA